MCCRYDGYAASVGFRTGDIIIGIEACYPANRSTGPLLEELEVQMASGEATSVEPFVAAGSVRMKQHPTRSL